ncbi:MAG TPA: hypothetical protein VEY91_02845 [Candidatus Limnocylindria bacterium]|nr:hypothetical protein [Candidatus Limnocylindria bacterium]
MLSLQAARSAGAWTFGARAGVSIPLGDTEVNPFELGRRGLRHQHVQFGSGTWDPVLGAGIARDVAGGVAGATARVRLSLVENRHGLRGGHRYHLSTTYGRGIGGQWSGRAGIDYQREEAEKWEGRIEEEGNLGRTDMLGLLVLGRAIRRLGVLELSIRWPLHSRANGQQAHYPVVYSLGWSR